MLGARCWVLGKLTPFLRPNLDKIQSARLCRGLEFLHISTPPAREVEGTEYGVRQLAAAFPAGSSLPVHVSPASWRRTER